MLSLYPSPLRNQLKASSLPFSSFSLLIHEGSSDHPRPIDRLRVFSWLFGSGARVTLYPIRRPFFERSTSWPHARAADPPDARARKRGYHYRGGANPGIARATLPPRTNPPSDLPDPRKSTKQSPMRPMIFGNERLAVRSRIATSRIQWPPVSPTWRVW